jgi:hypothetical protein
MPEILAEFKDRKIIGGIGVSIEPNNLLEPLSVNLYNYTKGLEETLLMMFVHERKAFEKIFDFSLTERTARIIEIPLLAIPKE